jgi:hypothetical protein
LWLEKENDFLSAFILWRGIKLSSPAIMVQNKSSIFVSTLNEQRDSVTRDRCYDFKIIGKKFSKNIGVFCSNCYYFLQKINHNTGF